ncbi:hypothetical protein K1719_036946 [Acacia pycnantha]|nr:hypothetical protein K1719_036946 [Acacia pycnantha]
MYFPCAVPQAYILSIIQLGQPATVKVTVNLVLLLSYNNKALLWGSCAYLVTNVGWLRARIQALMINVMRLWERRPLTGIFPCIFLCGFPKLRKCNIPFSQAV